MKVKVLLRWLRPVIGVLVFIGAFIACEEDPITIGDGVIRGEPFNTGKRTYDVFAYNKKIDAVPTNKSILYQLGTFNDPIYGRTEASITTQLTLAGATGNPTFGNFSQEDEDNPGTGESSTEVPENETVTEVRLFIPFLQNPRGDRDLDGVVDEEDLEPEDPNNDSDGDGLSNNQERAGGTDPLNPDTDGDGINDADDENTPQNIFPVRADLDSIFGDRNTAFNFKVAVSDFFLRDLDPNLGFQEAQEYFSSQQFSPSFIGETLFEGVLNIDEFETVILNEDDPETTVDESETVKDRFEPGILVNLDTDFFQQNVIDKEGQSELLSQANFNFFLRGLHLTVSSTDANEDLLFLLDLTAGRIIISYEHDALVNDEMVKQEKDYELRLITRLDNSAASPIIGNAANTLINDAFPQGILDQLDTGENASRIYLKGAAGSYAEVKLFDAVNGEDIINEIKANNWIINEANLVFYVDRDELDFAGTVYEPPRLYLYNAETNQPIYNPLTEPSAATANSLLAIFPNYDGILEKSGDQGIKYTVRITDHINNIIVRDSSNATLGLTLTPDVRITAAANTMLAGGIEEEIPLSGNLNPLSTVLIGSNVPETEEKKLKLEIFFTETN